MNKNKFSRTHQIELVNYDIIRKKVISLVQ